MDRRCTPENGFSYSNLFNLEPLMSYRLPQQEEDFDSYENSSQDESRGECADLDNVNGHADRSTGVNMKSRKRRASEPDSGLVYSSSNDEDVGSYGAHISEEQYRSMLGEHVQKYRRLRFKEPSGPASNRMVAPTQKHGHSMKIRKLVDEPFALKEELTAPNSENTPEQNGLKFGSKYSSDSRFFSSLESSYLDLGEGITYKIPPTYDKLVVSLKLPSYSDIRVEDHFLKGTLDLQSLASMVGSDKGFKTRSKGGMGDPVLQYESLQARLKALSSNSPHKFSLQVCAEAMDPFGIPEGAAGRIRRLILSESGALQVYYVKVLEKGDTYEIIERSLPKKHLAKKDQMMIEREEIDKIGKVWANIARREIPKHHRIFNSIHKKHLLDAKRFSETCQREVKLKVSRSLRVMKGSSIRTRKLARDVLLFWKRVEKEQAEQRKKEEKEAAEALKREEELREAKRQQQRLNFLLSQTELYSHFMQNKPAPQSSEALAGEVGDLRASETVLISPEAENEEDLEELELKREALRAAQHAVSQQKKITSAFDSECLKLRQSAEPEAVKADSVMGSSDIDLLHPSTMPVTSSVQTPAMFRGTLKEYQIKGLQWLVNCYEQGLNGILADEMGLGKTIQAMAFLAHLAEEKNIWGPFLVVAPSSVLNNWADEVSRFCPSLKTLPYWGGLQERTVLRKHINPKRLYRREAGFHILITSYQLLVLDEKYLRRVKWQYMVLDEAQAIKSSSSTRWKTLLSFNCRNRLLLTGTPIQNNMAELWALLHFIMPTLFDSHEQFNEWFSKGIENHAEHGGTLNEHQLNRLHAVLKPFMLRRVKKDVISEMTGKTEVTVHCPLSSRQQVFYQAIKNKISLSELIEGRSGRLHDKKLQNLMNIVIQLRKVCNHPELFERNEGSTYVYFSEISNPLQPPPFGELDIIHYPGGWNPIHYMIPKLVYQEIIQGVEVPSCHGVSPDFFERHFSVFLPENIYRSALPNDRSLGVFDGYGESFGFARLMGLSPVEISFLMKGSIFERLLFSVMTRDRMFIDEIVDMFVELEGEDLQHENLDSQKVRAVSRMLLIPSKSDSSLLRRKLATGPGDAPYEALTISFQDRLIANTRLLHSIYAFIPRVQAPPICTLCSDRSFAYRMMEELHNPWVKRLLVGFARTSEFNGPSRPNGPHPLIREIDSELPVSQPVLENIYKIFGSSPPMRNFDPSKMLTESGKLQVLDNLLKRLRAENHRVLLFAQMTKMLDILEDYMNYRKYRYLRLDGSSTIVDRRDMVRDFQRRSDIFVFLLSTRAGGLGINLTAADTVIFFESDWNPTLDLQAMDRAHRLGQTKEVTVYRLICKETVEEKILQRASQKNTVQQLVMTGGHVQDDSLDPSDFLSLLLDDAQLEQKLREIPLQYQARERQKKKGSKRLRVDAEGNATLEEFPVGELDGGSGQDPILDSQDGSTNKKRKSNSKKQPASNLRNQPDADENGETGLDDDATLSTRPKRAKKKKSINENLEPAVSIAADPVSGGRTDNTQTPYDSGSAGYEARFDVGTTSDAPSPV